MLSPLLANLTLHGLDCRMKAQGLGIVRDADDFVILCADEPQAREALRQVQIWCTARQLTLHPGKTHSGDCREQGQGFELLGYRFEGGRRWVRKKCLKALKDKIRARTRRTRGDSLACITRWPNAFFAAQGLFTMTAAHAQASQSR